MLHVGTMYIKRQFGRMQRSTSKLRIEIKTSPISIAIDPHACAVKAKEKYFGGWKTIGHFPKEISCYVYFFIKNKNWTITGNVESFNYKLSPIPSGELEIHLQLTFSCPVEWVQDIMKDFIDGFYTYDFTGILHNDKALMTVTLKLT